MQCRYCGKDVPLRMRIIGETGFCSPEHKRKHQDENSRIGLERLMEEATPPNAEPETSGARAEPIVVANAPRLHEPVQAATRFDLRLWSFPAIQQNLDPLAAKAMRVRFEPMDHVAGVARADSEDSQDTELTGEAAVAEAPVVEPEAEPAWAEEEESTPIDFDFHSLGLSVREPQAKQGLGRVVKYIAAAALAAALGVVGYFAVWDRDPVERAPATAATAAPVDDEWMGNWAESGHGEHIALFGPSKDWADYLVESVARPEQSVSWVFRARDPENYYTLKLAHNAPGEVRLIRCTVIEGETSDDQVTTFTLPVQKDVYGVRLEVRGPKFTLFLDGRHVADWQDTRLLRGGFGVMSQSLDFAQRKAVKVTRLARDSAYHAKPPGRTSLSAQLDSIIITRMDDTRKESN